MPHHLEECPPVLDKKKKRKQKKGGQACLRSFVGGQIKKHLGYINDMGDLLCKACWK